MAEYTPKLSGRQFHNAKKSIVMMAKRGTYDRVVIPNNGFVANFLEDHV